MRRRIGAAALAVATIAIGCGESSEGTSEFRRYSIEQFVSTASLRGSSFSPDESEILFTSDRDGVFNAFLAPVEGGSSRRITHSRETPIYSISFLPRDRRILYAKQTEGRDYHIFVRQPDGQAKDLTPHEGSWAEFLSWSRDRKSFFYSSNRRDSEKVDLYEMDLATFRSRLLYRNDEGFYLGPVSDDRRYVALHRLHSDLDSDLFLFDRATKLLKHLTPHDGEVFYKPETFEVGSWSLYYLSDEGSEFKYLMRYDAQTGTSGKVEEAGWDILYARFSRTGKYRVVGVNNDGRTEVRIYETAGGKRLPLPKMPRAQISGVHFSDSEKLMAFYADGARSPNDLWVYDLQSREARQLTQALHSDIDPEHLVEAESVRFPSFDGRPIPALLYRPRNIPANAKVPGLIWVHGGPGSQEKLRFSPPIQYFANHGYAVLAVNYRGSAGYGKTFTRLDDRRHGRDDLADCVEGKNYLAATGFVDPRKIAIIGGSYGGYLVLAALAFRPLEFAAGVDLFGPSDLASMLRSFPPWREPERSILFQEMGDPDQDAEYLASISPLHHSQNIERPLLIVQGGKDRLAPRKDAERLVAELEARGAPVEYLLLEGEAHGMRRRSSRVRAYRAILEFLDRSLEVSRPTQGEPQR